MSTKEKFNFDYSVKVIAEDGTESKVKKSATAEAIQFESVADAIAYFEAQEAGKGEALLIKDLNDSLKATAIANLRASLTRVPSIPKTLRDKANEKLTPEQKDEFNKLMALLGVQKLPEFEVKEAV